MKKYLSRTSSIMSCFAIVAFSVFVPLASENITINIQKNKNSSSHLLKNNDNFTNEMQLNSTWASDKYAATKGYVYTPPNPYYGTSADNWKHATLVYRTSKGRGFDRNFKWTSDKWLLSLNSDGLVVNEAIRNSYNNIKRVSYGFPNDDLIVYKDGYKFIGSSMNVKSTFNFYNYLNGEYSANLLNTDMTFGTWENLNTSKSKTFSLESKKITQSTPFFKLTMPSFFAYASLNHFSNYSAASDYFTEDTIGRGESQFKMDGYDKQSTSEPATYDWNLQDSKYDATNWYYIWYEEYPSGWKNTYTCKFNVTTTEIAIFNDYDGNVLKNTYLFDNAWNGALKTSYDSLVVDTSSSSSLQVKDKIASSQVQNVASNLTLKGKNIGHQFMRDGTLTITPDDSAGKLTVQFMPKSAFNEKGELVPYSGKPVEKVITGFSISKTLIKVLDSYSHDIVVDKWKGTVASSSGIVNNKQVLGNYLDLSTVPTNAVLTINNEKYDFIKGVITFDIQSNQIITHENKILDTPSAIFTISLQFIPRITKLQITNNNPLNRTADEVKADLFNSSDKLINDGLGDYGEIIAPADNAKYYLVPNSYQAHTGDGTVKFAVWADNYYDKNGNPAVGSVANTSTHFNFNLQVNRTPTIIEKKENHPVDIRVNKFIDAVSDQTGVIDNLELFRKYVTVENLPSDCVLTITNYEYSEYTDTDYRDTVTFDLKATKYNYDQTHDGGAKEWNFKNLSLTLEPQHKKTDIVVKSDDILLSLDRIDIFKKNVESKSGKDLINYLKDYLNFTSLRNDASLTANVSSYDPYNGNIKLDIDITNYYDENNDYHVNDTVPFNNVSLNLFKQPTEVKIISKGDPKIRVDRYLKTIADETTGEINQEAFKKYVTIDIWEPTIKKLEIDMNTVIADDSSGIWTGDLLIYDVNNDNNSRHTKRLPLKFEFAEKHAPTTIDYLVGYEPIYLDNFLPTLFDENNVAKEPEIYDYLDVVSMPIDAKIILLDHTMLREKAQVEIKVEVTSYYDEDSDLREPKIDNSKSLIRDFTFDLLSPETEIAKKVVYPSDQRVDRFWTTFKDLKNVDLKTFLLPYVDFNNLPENIELNIDQENFSMIEIMGQLTFNIVASRYFDADGYLQTTNKAFPITLNLAKKYASTSITAKTTYTPTHRVDRFIAALGANQTNPEITNLEVLNQYVDVISIPENAKLSVDFNQAISLNKDTGELTFWIKTDKYYNDPDCDLIEEDFLAKITLNLNVVHKPTTIKEKPQGTYDNSIRVDRFLTKFINPNNNLVTDMNFLQQFVDIYSLPTNTKLYVSNAKPDFKSGQITFNLIASQYYETTDSNLISDSIVENKNPFPINLQLTPRPAATNFIARIDYSKDHVLINELTAYIAPGGVVNLERFQQYIKIISLPDATKIELQEVSYSTTTGNIEYNVIVDQYYDADGDLQTKTATYPVALQLNPLYAETQIYALSNYPTSLDITTFKNYVVDANGNVIVDNLQKFVGIESLPPTSQLSIIWGAETATTIEFIVHASKYYNSQNRLADDKDFNIYLKLMNDMQTTNIVAWAEYPAIGAHQFFNLVNPNNKINYTQLNKYLDLSTVPFNADLSISKPVSNSKTGLVTFDITTSTWYDDNGVLQTTPKTFEIALQLTPKYPETYLFGIQSIDKNMTLEGFWAQISTYDVLDQVKLAQYVDLDTLVPNTKLQYLNPTKHFDGSISFDLVVDRYYDADGIENFGRKVFRIILSNLTINQQTSQIQDLTWLYVVIALLSSTSIGLIWFLIAKNKKRKEKQN